MLGTLFLTEIVIAVSILLAWSLTRPCWRERVWIPLAEQAIYGLAFLFRVFDTRWWPLAVLAPPVLLTVLIIR